MAIAGLHNVSVLDSSFLRESQSESVRRRGDDGRSSTRASSLLQMWRELEDEHVVGHARGGVSERLLQRRSDGSSLSPRERLDVSNSHGSEQSVPSEDGSVGETDFGQWSPGPIGSENGQDDSSDLGEVERERVRQIFREWMSSGARERTSSNISRRNNGSRAEWLGETEQERVRIIREWVQMNTRQRGARSDCQEEQGSEVGQIEQVLDGLVVNNTEGQREHTRRGIRRLCGRQALLDMLKKAERERQRELEGLLEHRAVSQFAHRNRIQSLLRGRFLRNDRMIENGERISTAASELGLLRQRHTVSDLREGFSSRRLDNSVCGQASSSASDTSSNTDTNGNGSEQTQGNNLQQVIGQFHEQMESSTEDSDGHGSSDGRTDIQCNVGEDLRLQESSPHLEEGLVQAPEHEVIDEQHSSNVEFVESRGNNVEEVTNHSWDGIHDESSLEIMENEAGEGNHLWSTVTVSSQQNESNREDGTISMPSSLVDSSENNGVQEINHRESTTQVEHWQSEVLEIEERDSFEPGLESIELRHGIQDNVDGNQHQTVHNQWLENEDTEEASEVWHEEGGFQEAVQSWLEEPSDSEALPVGQMHSFYLPDDDNVYSMELRELLSRRSVSTLLRSGFRESLDQLIRSYVERQSHAPLDWELQGSSAEQDLEQQSGGHNEVQGGSVQSLPLAPPTPPMAPVQQLWDQENHYGWPQHDMRQHFGIEWDIINDLRIDMARLQQRMNNMQRMLEACMDMQLELQRSIRQEVSAALNRSAGPSGVSDNSLPEDGSKWDHVRKGKCCICCDSNIDTLLYRCGHMCTCSKCANELVQSGEKCPMCRAPVIEVIRAYSIV